MGKHDQHDFHVITYRLYLHHLKRVEYDRRRAKNRAKKLENYGFLLFKEIMQ
jgi:hypothetical protein